MQEDKFENEVVSVESVEGFKVFYNFKKEELLRVKEEFYPFLDEYFTGHLKCSLEIVRGNLESLTSIITNQMTAQEKAKNG